jgi:hypothetical protein
LGIKKPPQGFLGGGFCGSGRVWDLDLGPTISTHKSRARIINILHDVLHKDVEALVHGSYLANWRRNVKLDVKKV